MEISNSEIAELRQMKFRLECAVKSGVVPSQYKQIVLNAIDKVKMPLATWGRKSREEIWSSFIGMVSARIDTELNSLAVAPVVIQQIKNFIRKVNR